MTSRQRTTSRRSSSRSASVSRPTRERVRPAPVQTTPIAPLLLSVPEVAAMLHMCERKAWTLIGRGDIFSIMVGRSRRIPRQCVEEYVESLIAGAA